MLSLAVALLVASGLSLYAIALYLLKGTAAFDAIGTSVSVVVVVYFVTAVVASVVVALLLPVGRTRVGAIFVGIIASLPLYPVMRVAVKGFAPWEPEDTFSMVACPLLFGSAMGLMYWHIFKGSVLGSGR